MTKSFVKKEVNIDNVNGKHNGKHNLVVKIATVFHGFTLIKGVSIQIYMF